MNFTLSTEEKAKGWQYRSASSVVFHFPYSRHGANGEGRPEKGLFPRKTNKGFPLRSLSGCLPEVAVEEDAEQCQADGKGRPDTGQLHGRIARYEYESQQIGEYRC